MLLIANLIVGSITCSKLNNWPTLAQTNVVCGYMFYPDHVLLRYIIYLHLYFKNQYTLIKYIFKGI
jgi:hypothetical protein